MVRNGLTKQRNFKVEYHFDKRKGENSGKSMNKSVAEESKAYLRDGSYRLFQWGRVTVGSDIVRENAETNMGVSDGELQKLK